MSRFKEVRVATNRQTIEMADQQTRKSDRAGYHKIKDGKNVFRIAPPHEEGDPSLEPMCKVWLPREVTDRDGKKVIKNMPVLSSKVHSPIGRDIVDEYITFLVKMMNNDYGRDEAKKKLAPVFGFRDRTGTWVSGILPSLGFVCYAWKDGVLGRLELTKQISDRMNDLSIDEEGDETISVDPFASPTSGVSLIVTYDKSADSGKKYKVSKGSKPSALSEEQEEELFKSESLKSMLRNAFSKSDFQNQLDGLRLFDAQHKFGVMDMDEFVAICEEMADIIDACPDIRESAYDEQEDGGEVQRHVDSNRPAPVAGAPVAGAHIARQNDTSDDDGFDDLSIEELKEYIEDKELDIIVKPAYSKSKIIGLIREAISGANDLPFDKRVEVQKEQAASNQPENSTQTARERFNSRRRS